MEFMYYKPSRAEQAASTSARPVFDSSRSIDCIWPKQGESHMTIMPLGEAKTNLSKLVDEAAAGKVITIAKHGRAMAQLVPMGNSKGRRIGAMKGKLAIPENFDAPLPDEVLDAFEGNLS